MAVKSNPIHQLKLHVRKPIAVTFFIMIKMKFQ